MASFKRQYNEPKVVLAPKKKTTQNAVAVFEEEPPITGGNTYTTKALNDAQIQLDLNTIPKYNPTNISDIINTRISDKTYTEWFLLNFHADYFVSVFPVSFMSIELDRAVYACFRIHFLYGNCGIYKLGNLAIPIFEVSSKISKSGTLIEVKYQYAYEVLAQQSLQPEAKIYTLKEEDLINYARLPLTSQGFPAIVTWMPFIKTQQSLLRKIYMYSFLFTKKIKFSVADPTSSNSELETFFNDEDSPFYKEMAEASGLQSNKFSVEGLPSEKGSSDIDDIINFYNFVVSSYYNLLGRRFNVDAKAERNITAEVDASQDNFDILQNESIVYKRNFLNKVSELFGVSWYQTKKEGQNDTE